MLAPKALTSSGDNVDPILNPLTDGKVIISWTVRWGNGPYYAAINSSGSISKAITSLNATRNDYATDAVQLPNGNMAIAWGIDRGPVKIESDHGGASIVAAERVIYKVNGVDTSFTEMMAMPASQLDTTYWLPWYNSKTLDTQLRFAVP